MNWRNEKKTPSQRGPSPGTGAYRRLIMAVVVVSMVGMLGAACSVRRVELPACSDRRLDLAFALFDQAREKMALHFKQRVDSALGEAYQASSDSVLLARATRNCHDFDAVVRRHAIDLIKSNILFQKLITSNMRDQDSGVVVDLYGPRYREIFKNDIQ